MSERRPPPGPRGHPILGSSLGFRNDPLRTFGDGWREFGNLVLFRGPVTVYLVTDPDHIEHILVRNFDNYPHPDDFDRKVGTSVGRGLVTTNGEVWRQQRRTVEPTFHRQQLQHFAGVMRDRTSGMLDRWAATAATGQPLDVSVEMRSLTLDILSRCLFSTDWAAEAHEMGDAVRVQLEHLNRKLIAVVDLPEWIPTRNNRAFRKARRWLDTLVNGLIADRRRGDGDPDGDDLLSMLMHAPDPETGQLMTDRQLRDQVMTLFIAGHETAATTLAWALYLLAQHRDVADRIRAELGEVLADREPSMADLPNLKYLRMVLQEVLRLYPPLWQIPRMPLQDDELGGYHIPAKSFLLLNMYLAHRNPAHWDDPERFDPERFTRERSKGRPRYAYLPYAGGPRNCVGLGFANMELSIVVASVLRRFRLDLVPEHPVVLQPDLALRAKHGILLTACPVGSRV